MPIVLAIAGFFVPRFVLGLLWFFTDRMYEAFGNWQAPLLGFLFLPYATLVYTILVTLAGSLSTIGWIVVGLALCLDLNRWADEASKKAVKSHGVQNAKLPPGKMVIDAEAT